MEAGVILVVELVAEEEEFEVGVAVAVLVLRLAMELRWILEGTQQHLSWLLLKN